MNSDKAMNATILELTQKIQLHFPRKISLEMLKAWNGCEVKNLTQYLNEMFSKYPFGIDIVKQFSLDKDVVPNKEFIYECIPPYMRDKYFNPSTLSGPATIKIVPTTKDMTTKKIADKYQQTDALAIIKGLHNMLVAGHNLDAYKNRAIIVPVMSILPYGNGGLFCLCLDWFGDGWRWRDDWVGRWKAGVHVASVAQ
ncbi:MAG: hypothetical protein UT42_C0040G0001 [Candidatus Falkowbacteria bacterium GW2011_GWA2_39_24]|uniref:Uncharacterized protein n=1 Tax=Candidatus Falkowbacteria bacterium GW2011_GWA2_39_24 TaxID=1618634 RepID=A0A0G0QTL0_9BACT|nr:MAG: hypothetical protein UT42_C0040G0001 [Candidatus Falkowbacteria bacterium GW2011_GWA2_39_24]